MENFTDYGTTCIVFAFGDVFLPEEKYVYEARVMALKAVGSPLAETLSREDCRQMFIDRSAKGFDDPIWNGKPELARRAYYETYLGLWEENKLFSETVQFLNELRYQADQKGIKILLLDRKTHALLEMDLNKFGIKHFFDRVQGSLRHKEIDKPEWTAFEMITGGLDTSKVVMIGPPKDRAFAAKCKAEFIELPSPEFEGEGIKLLLAAIS